jgi:hypothetical protein
VVDGELRIFSACNHRCGRKVHVGAEGDHGLLSSKEQRVFSPGERWGHRDYVVDGELRVFYVRNHRCGRKVHVGERDDEGVFCPYSAIVATLENLPTQTSLQDCCCLSFSSSWKKKKMMMQYLRKSSMQNLGVVL